VLARLYVLSAVVGLTAAPVAAQPKGVGRYPAIETLELPNGLKVAFLRVDTAPAVAVQVWYHAGSKDEPRDRRGSAHMFEHMMFKGTAHVRAEGHAQLITAVGGTSNAATDEDATHFVDTVPGDFLDFAIQLEAERMRGLLFRKAMIDGEREVVKEEIRQQENSPIALGFLHFLAVAYTKHPYAWTAGGDIHDLDATTPDDLKKFYDAYYQPNNAVLVVVGRTTLEQVKASAERWFGKIEKAPAPPRPAAQAEEPAQTSKRHEVVEPGQIGLTAIGWHIPGAKDKDLYALQVASIVLGAGDSSRLKQRLKATDPKTKRSLALDGGTDAIVREDPGMIVAVGVYLDKDSADPVEAAILDEVAKLAAKGPTAEELRKAKNQVQSGFTFSLEKVQGLAEAMGRSWIQTGDPTSFQRDVEEIEKVSAADVQRVIKHYLTPDKATTVVLPPKAR
jgi:zinc protease